MPFANIQINFPKEIDLDAFSANAQKRLKAALRKGAEIFIMEVKEHVPYYTGTSRGSLQEAAKVAAIPMSRVLEGGLRTTPKSIRLYNHLIKKGHGPSLGRRRGFAQIRTRKHLVEFIIDTRVDWYKKNEEGEGLQSPPLRHPVPWKSFEKGKLAFAQNARELIRNALPNPWRFTIPLRIGKGFSSRIRGVR